MNLIQTVGGRVRLRYTSADTGGVLAQLERMKIEIYDVVAVDEFSMELTASAKEIQSVFNMAERRGERATIIARMGLVWTIRTVLHRKILWCGILFLLTIGFLLPGRILFISVEGNSTIPAGKILESAEAAGLKFGTLRRSVRSEQLKNRLLDEIPELKWAGVNTYGSRAVITVRERDAAQENKETFGVRHMVACRDGVIVSYTVTNGCGICTVGQAVKRNDVLISGYTDCGITILASAASGEVFARTNRNLTVLTPADYLNREGFTGKLVHYSLILGKKRINFYKGSGISGGTCVKISKEYVLTLPGGYELPLSVVKEEILDYALAASNIDNPELLLKEEGAGYLDEQMVSGTVITKEESVIESGRLWILEGQYSCIENIAVAQDEKIGELHGKTD